MLPKDFPTVDLGDFGEYFPKWGFQKLFPKCKPFWVVQTRMFMRISGPAAQRPHMSWATSKEAFEPGPRHSLFEHAARPSGAPGAKHGCCWQRSAGGQACTWAHTCQHRLAPMEVSSLWWILHPLESGRANIVLRQQYRWWLQVAQPRQTIATRQSVVGSNSGILELIAKERAQSQDLLNRFSFLNSQKDLVW